MKKSSTRIFDLCALRTHPPYFTYISMGKLVLNYVRFQQSIACIKGDRTALVRLCPMRVPNHRHKTEKLWKFFSQLPSCYFTFSKKKSSQQKLNILPKSKCTNYFFHLTSSRLYNSVIIGCRKTQQYGVWIASSGIPFVLSRANPSYVSKLELQWYRENGDIPF